jgi:hypothetical protein
VIGLILVEEAPSQDPAFWQQASWVASTIGILVAAATLFFNWRTNVATAKAERARFWLELRKMFASYDEVNRKLQKGGVWYARDDRPKPGQELTEAIPYLGLFEISKRMMDQGLLDEETFNSLYRYRLRAILRNGPIKQKLLNPSDDDDKDGYKDFKALVKQVDDDRGTLQDMLKDPRGGTTKKLTKRELGEKKPPARWKMWLRRIIG